MTFPLPTHHTPCTPYRPTPFHHPNLPTFRKSPHRTLPPINTNANTPVKPARTATTAFMFPYPIRVFNVPATIGPSVKPALKTMLLKPYSWAYGPSGPKKSGFLSWNFLTMAPASTILGALVPARPMPARKRRADQMAMFLGASAQAARVLRDVELAGVVG